MSYSLVRADSLDLVYFEMWFVKINIFDHFIIKKFLLCWWRTFAIVLNEQLNHKFSRARPAFPKPMPMIIEFHVQCKCMLDESGVIEPFLEAVI